MSDTPPATSVNSAGSANPTGLDAADAGTPPSILPTGTPAGPPTSGPIDEDALLVGLERGDWTRTGTTGGRRGLAAFGDHQMLAKLILSLIGVLFFAPLLYLAIVTLTSVSHAAGH